MGVTDRRTQATIGQILVDVVSRLNPSEPLKVTSHPVEDGSVISEHIAEDPKTLTLDVTFTDDEYSIPVGQDVTDVVGGVTTAADKRDAVKKLRDTRQIITVETMRDHYPNMVLLEIQEDVTPQNASAFQATLVFQQVRLSTTGTASLPVDKLKKKTQTKKDAGLNQAPQSDEGTQATEELSQADKDVISDLLSPLRDAVS